MIFASHVVRNECGMVDFNKQVCDGDSTSVLLTHGLIQYPFSGDSQRQGRRE